MAFNDWSASFKICCLSMTGVRRSKEEVIEDLIKYGKI